MLRYISKTLTFTIISKQMSFHISHDLTCVFFVTWPLLGAIIFNLKTLTYLLLLFRYGLQPQATVPKILAADLLTHDSLLLPLPLRNKALILYSLYIKLFISQTTRTVTPFWFPWWRPWWTKQLTFWPLTSCCRPCLLHHAAPRSSTISDSTVCQRSGTISYTTL